MVAGILDAGWAAAGEYAVADPRTARNGTTWLSDIRG